jgi:hypothetical protein
VYYKCKCVIKRIIDEYYAEMELMGDIDRPKAPLHIHRNDIISVIPTNNATRVSYILSMDGIGGQRSKSDTTK